MPFADFAADSSAVHALATLVVRLANSVIDVFVVRFLKAEMDDFICATAEHSWAFAADWAVVVPVVIVAPVDFVELLDELDPQAAVVRSAAPMSGAAHASRRACRIDLPFVVILTAAGVPHGVARIRTPLESAVPVECRLSS